MQFADSVCNLQTGVFNRLPCLYFLCLYLAVPYPYHLFPPLYIRSTHNIATAPRPAQKLLGGVPILQRVLGIYIYIYAFIVSIQIELEPLRKMYRGAGGPDLPVVIFLIHILYIYTYRYIYIYKGYM